MNYTKEEYIKEVLKYIGASKKTKRRIKEDLDERISEATTEDVFYDFIQEMGEPKAVAIEFMENLEHKDGYGVITIGISTSAKMYEYKSKLTIFGLPLVHINTGGRYLNRVAKGIVAIGDISIGVVSIGGIAIGALSFGGLGLGIISIAGIAIGGIAIGGIAIGAAALGGIALGIYKAFGDITHIL